ncbi:hypothetical protein TNCV_4877001 [Trichonephila clavipes]|nr:hypothetical protein TNCV_4877001 [Trichonephila clavipes]
MRRLASKSRFYTREKQEVAFDWLDLDESKAESGFGWAMKENRVKPLCTQYKERVQQNSVGQWVGKKGCGSGYSCHNEGWKTIKKSIHGATAFSIKSWTPERENVQDGR